MADCVWAAVRAAACGDEARHAADLSATIIKQMTCSPLLELEIPPAPFKKGGVPSFEKEG